MKTNKKAISLVVLIIFIIILAILATVAIMSIGGKKEDTAGGSSSTTDKFSGTTVEDTQKQDEYLSMGLKLYDESEIYNEGREIFKKLQGNIKEINCSNAHPEFLAGNKIYSDSFNLEEIADIAGEYSDFYYFDDFPEEVFLEDKNGRITCYNLENKEIVFSGLDSSNVVRIIVGNEFITVLKNESDGVYAERCEVKNKKLQLVKRFDVSIKLQPLGENATIKENVNSVFYKNDASAYGIYFILSDNTVHKYTIGCDIDEEGDKLIFECLTKTYLTNVDKIFTSSIFKTPIYSQIGDSNNLYVYVSAGNKISDGDIQKTIPLPTGYKTNDIKNIIGDSTSSILIEFNDKNIYLLKNAGKETYSITMQETVSKLNKENKILDVECPGTNIYLLMDNNKVYVASLVY